MVLVETLSVIAAIGFIALILWLLRGTPSRYSEELQEEADTIKLRKDEKAAEKVEQEEKKECEILSENLRTIDPILRKNKQGVIADKMIGEITTATVMLSRLANQKMNLQSARQTFLQLNSVISQIISILPDNINDIREIKKMISSHKNNFYTDLITEMELKKDEKKLLMKMWGEIEQQERGNLQLKAA